MESPDFLVVVLFFLVAGFFGGSVSSTTVFLGGSAGIIACAFVKSVRKRVISASFAVDKLSSLSASCFRVFSNELRSLESDCRSSLEPNAPAPAVTLPSTS